MSLKSIEMQVALPRTVDANKKSEQLQQRGQIINDHGTDKMAEKLEKERQTIIETNQKDAAIIKDRQDKDRREPQQQKRKDKKNDKKQKEIHPYKGKRIDYSG